MNIILDTNIYQANFSLESNQIDALNAYLRKTDQSLILPYVVKEEVSLNFKGELKKHTKALITLTKAIEKCAIDLQYKSLTETILNFSIKDNEFYNLQASSYIEYIKNKIHSVIECELPDLSLQKILDRALDKEKPFRESGEGFKDSILWEEILEYCERENLDSIIFISNNSKDFGKEQLHPNLEKETVSKNIKVYYYNSLKDFINERLESVNSIELSVSDLDKYELELDLNSYIESYHHEVQRFLREQSTDSTIFSDVESINIDKISSIEKYNVIDIDIDVKYVSATLICSVDVNVVCQIYSEFINQYTGDVDYNFDLESGIIFSDVLIEVDLKYTNEGYSEFEIITVDFLR